MWYNLLDVAALNAFLIFSTQNPEFEVGKTHKRRLFLRNLAKELVIPQMRRRLRVTTNLRSTVFVARDVEAEAVEAVFFCGSGNAKKSTASAST